MYPFAYLLERVCLTAASHTEIHIPQRTVLIIMNHLPQIHMLPFSCPLEDNVYSLTFGEQEGNLITYVELLV